MKSALRKDTLREIKGSFGRFFSILMIVAIGVAFFAGVKAAVPDMKYTADQYYDDGNLMDIRVLSTLGLSQEDVDAIRELEGVEGVFATHTKEVLTQIDKSQLVLKVHALPIDDLSDENEDYLNRPVLMEGRLPQASGECVIEKGELRSLDVNLGDKILLESGDEQSLSDDLKVSEYTIVGTVQTPYYLSIEKGNASIGSGKVDYFMMIPQSDFISDIYTEVNITVANARNLNSYDETYFDATDPVKEKLEAIATTRQDLRFEEIQQEAQGKLDDAMVEYEDGLHTFESEIANNETKLKDANRELVRGRASLEEEKTNFQNLYIESMNKIVSGKEQIAKGYIDYEAGYKTYTESLVSLKPQMDQLRDGITKAEAGIKQIDAQIQGIETALSNPNLDEATRVILQGQLSQAQAVKTETTTQVTSLKQTLSTITTQLDASEKQLTSAKTELDAKQIELTNSEVALQEGKAKADEEFFKANQKLVDGQKEYDEGMNTLTKAKADGQEELAIAKEKLDKAQLDIKDLPQAEWFVLDRESHYSYMDYGSVADRMDGIAKIFPLFFFLVAALVCLTTMTRMVDEQRSDIGTLKALGYARNAIASKYIAYAGIASVIGSIVGCLIGMSVFPTIIFNAWNLMYTLPTIQFVSQPVLALGASGIVIAITIMAAYLAVYKELVETPSLLMRPKAPPAGKKILLERMGWLWNRFTFSKKVTARNLFRYKKRFFMTVIGISGCTALLVAGFGIQDSISQVVSKQYGEILQYDVSMNYNPDSSIQEKKDGFEMMQKDEMISDIMGITQENASLNINDKEEALTLIAPSDVNTFQQFVSLHKRGSSTDLELSDEGVLISEKLSMNGDIEIGDTIRIKDKDEIPRDIVVSGIIENYIGHYIYMSPEYYKEVFHERATSTTLIAHMKDTGNTQEIQLGNRVMEHKQFKSISFFSGVANSFQDTISSLNFIVVVLVIAAGMLAFVVLYNLTNVNISERLREIATIKVLGFYDKEVAEYVYRENILLTIIGSLCGLLMGIGLHRMIMNLAEMENIMFGRNIDFISFIYALLITMAFALIVNAFMYRKLRNIPMVESLKSIE